jgi:hypothetical protein
MEPSPIFAESKNENCCWYRSILIGGSPMMLKYTAFRSGVAFDVHHVGPLRQVSPGQAGAPREQRLDPRGPQQPRQLLVEPLVDPLRRSRAPLAVFGAAALQEEELAREGPSSGSGPDHRSHSGRSGSAWSSARYGRALDGGLSTIEA